MNAHGEDDLRDELEAHLRLDVAERMARGETREHAERAARRDFGNVTHVSEVTRDQHGGVWLERVVQDVRYGVRSLRRTPPFTIAAVLTLALAIGANSAVFSVVNGVLLRPLAFPHPDRLFLVSYLPKDLPFEPPPGLVDRQWLEYRQRQHAFERVGGYTRRAGTLTGAGNAVRLVGARVDADFFSVIDVAPSVGRVFARDEARANVVVLGNRLWRDRFSADSAIVGRSVSIDGAPQVVVGVMPSGFNFPGAADFWTPLSVTLDSHNAFILSVVGRMREGASVQQARSELQSVISAMPRDPRDPESPMEAAILPLKDRMTRNVAPSLFIFSGAVGFVLLIACVNVANLLLIRASSRRREIAVRMALGAGRLRIARQLLTESLLVAVAGGMFGILLAQLGLRALLAIAPEGRIPRVDEVRVDVWVLAFTMLVSLLTGVAFGLAPALQTAGRSPQEAMTHGGRTVGSSRSSLRGALVTIEVALALVLLTGAGLLVKSFVRIRGADKGFDGRNVVTMTVDLPAVRYPDVARQRAFHDRMLAELARMPSVRGVAGVTFKPMSDVGMMGDFVVDGPSPTPHGYGLDKVVVSPAYFSAMGVRLRGRDFSVADDDRSAGVLIVSESVARRVWPGSDPIGKRVSMSDDPKPEDWLTVIGVAADVVQDRTLEKHSTMYFPYAQSTWSFILGHMTYVVRSDLGAGIASDMRGALLRIDADLPAQGVKTMNDALLDVVAEPLFQTRLLSVFSLIAVLLAAIGTYGVLAYDVAERSREIALRMALGARPHDVVRMVMRRTTLLALSGAAIGIAAALALTRVLAKSLYDVKPNDGATMVVAVAAILLVALAAGFAPARSASRIHVLTALAD